MKAIFGIIAAILFPAILCYSQDEPDLYSLQSFTPELKKEALPVQGKIPFRYVIVYDSRFDTTKLGYVFSAGWKKINFPNSCAEALENMLNEYYKPVLDPTSAMTLVVFLKTYWLQSGGVQAVEEDYDVAHNPEFFYDKSGVCFADIDVFACSNNEYRALTRIKSEFIDAPYKGARLARFIVAPFDSLAKKLISSDIPALLSKKNPFTLAQITANYRKRFDLPVINNPEPAKGVYLSYQDFITRKPSYSSFIVKEGKISDELYITEGGGESILPDYWGYCDGRDYYIKLGFNAFKLYRQHKTWDLYGNRWVSLYSTTNNVAFGNNNLMFNKRNKHIYRRPLQLNPETGKVY